MKVLRYFPIIPRFRRMFKSLEMVEQLTWYTSHKSQDGKMRHPVDSPIWNTIDRKWPEFELFSCLYMCVSSHLNKQ